MDQKLLDELNRLTMPAPVAETKQYLKALLYGPPGHGKTTVAAHIGTKKLLLYTDPNWTVINKYPKIAETVDVQPFEGWSQAEAIAQAVIEGIKPWSDYTTLVIDTAGQAVVDLLQKIVGEVKYKTTNFREHPDLESWPDYRLARNQVRDPVRLLGAAPIHVVYTAHVKTPSEDDRKNNRLEDRALFPQEVYKLMAQQVNLIGYVSRSGDKRTVNTVPDRKRDAKTQFKNIDEKEYTTDEFIEAINSAIGK